MNGLHERVSVKADEIDVLLHRLVAKMVPDEVVLREGIHSVLLKVPVAQLLISPLNPARLRSASIDYDQGSDSLWIGNLEVAKKRDHYNDSDLVK